MMDTAQKVKLLRELAQDVPTAANDGRLIADAAFALARAMQPTYDQMQHLAYSAVVPAVIRAANDLELIKSLSGGRRSTAELVAQTGANEDLLVRILRCLAAYHVIEQAAVDDWSPLPLTKELARSGVINGFGHQNDTVNPGYQAIPAFLRKVSHQSPRGPELSAFNLAHNTDMQLFPWLQEHPENLAFFLGWLPAARSEDSKRWVDTDLPEVIASRATSADAVLFVDVGGSVGNQCVDLRKRVPRMVGRVINQDLPHIVANTIEHPGVEKSAHDFFSEQPIKGSRVYYMRNVLHDWSNEKAVQILKNLMPALTAGSEIWLDEFVLPDQGASEMQVNWDMTMLAAVNGMERSGGQWRRLLGEAGLVIIDTVGYNPQTGESIIRAALAAPES